MRELKSKEMKEVKGGLIPLGLLLLAGVGGGAAGTAGYKAGKALGKWLAS